MSLEETSPSFRYAMLSHVGRMRHGNEDFCAARPECGLFVVCDGMGGAAAGEVASEVAARTFVEYVQAGSAASGNDVEAKGMEPLLQAAAEAANTRVRLESRMEARRRGMGTTLVALLLEAEGEEHNASLWLTHVGDSRCYRLRGGSLELLTQDHSLVQEQILAGQMTVEQAERSPIRNIITRAIGSAPAVRAEIRRLTPEAGDVYLLASDGLTRELPDAAIKRLLVGASKGRPADLEALCASLVEAANAAGGRDNITVLLLWIAPDGLPMGFR